MCIRQTCCLLGVPSTVTTLQLRAGLEGCMCLQETETHWEMGCQAELEAGLDLEEG